MNVRPYKSMECGIWFRWNNLPFGHDTKICASMLVCKRMKVYLDECNIQRESSTPVNLHPKQNDRQGRGMALTDKQVTIDKRYFYISYGSAHQIIHNKGTYHGSLRQSTSLNDQQVGFEVLRNYYCLALTLRNSPTWATQECLVWSSFHFP